MDTAPAYTIEEVNKTEVTKAMILDDIKAKGSQQLRETASRIKVKSSAISLYKQFLEEYDTPSVGPQNLPNVSTLTSPTIPTTYQPHSSTYQSANPQRDEEDVINSPDALQRVLNKNYSSEQLQRWFSLLQDNELETKEDIGKVIPEQWEYLRKQRLPIKVENDLKSWASPATLPSQEIDPYKTLADLVLGADKHLVVSPHIIERAIKIYPQRVAMAVTIKSTRAAKEIYEDTQSLPQTQTERVLEVQGYHLNGPLIVGNEDLIICFDQHTRPCVLKALTTSEGARMEQLSSHNLTSNHIVRFNLVTRATNRYFMIMSMLPATLELVPSLSEASAERLWKHMYDALKCLHNIGYAHMDVKPSNICIDHDGNFVLIDLGSVVAFGQKTQTTRAYIPHGLDFSIAREDVDWWMLAATLTERGCGLRWGDGARNPNQHEVCVCLASKLPSVWDVLKTILQ